MIPHKSLHHGCNTASTATTMPRVKVREEKNTAVKEKIRCALEKSDREGTLLQDLAIEFEVPRSMLNDRQDGGNHGRKRMKRSRPCPQPSRVHWRSGRRRWTITTSLPGLTFSKWQRTRPPMSDTTPSRTPCPQTIYQPHLLSVE